MLFVYARLKVKLLYAESSKKLCIENHTFLRGRLKIFRNTESKTNPNRMCILNINKLVLTYI